MYKLIAGALVSLALPTAAMAYSVSKTERHHAAAACREERSAMGTSTFKETYGTNHNRSNAFGKCVAKRARAEDQSTTSARTDCRDERSSIGAEAFAEKYGTNKNKRNAFGKCVSSKASADRSEQTDQDVQAAQACRTERSTLGDDAFRAKYGTNHNGRNAFGKCVSKLAQAQGEDNQSGADDQ
jgi:hypothetical protein